MVNFEGAILMLENMGLSDVIIPFILIFTIVFGVLYKIGILGDNKKFYGIISLVLALSVVIPHVTNSYPNPNYDAVNIINNSLPNISVIVVAIVAALILIGVFGLKFPTGDKSPLASLLWIFSFGIVIYVFGASAGWGWSIPNWLGFLQDPDTQALLIIILVFGLIINYIMKDDSDKKNKEKFGKRWNGFIDDMTSDYKEPKE